VDLEAAVAALAPRLVAYALARTGSRADAEDIAQDALVALVRRWRRDGAPDSSEAFVFAIAKRRAGRVVVRRALMAPLDALREAAHREPSAERAFGDRSELTAVLAAVRRLRKADREALLLRVAGELDFDRIAALTRTTPAAVKMRISRARQKLRDLLPESGYGRRTGTG
jgi:RNA polymerase sigma-70 factor (ECF subfamily)